ncbi:MAG: PEP-CTERM sorting domain-containing protein [Phycisphaerae bacterium]|nr:PEP-CTERM sorting domain-containing protein [Phycisphaerae bacterium]
MPKRVLCGAVLVAVTCSASGVGAATITIYTDKTAWENAVGGQFLTEDFADDQLNPGISFVSSESGRVNSAQEYYQDVLASQSQNEPSTTWSFVPQITAYGGNWTLGGPGGSGNNLQVHVDDLSIYVGAISNSYNGGFWGFTSDTPLTSVRTVGGSGSHQQHYSLDDMVYSPVPEPATVGLLALGGLAVLRRKRG